MPTPWPPDAALEARIEALLSRLSLAQKVGQMTQPEIRSVTPAEVTQYGIGSVLNGGGSWPGGDKRANAAAWLALAEKYHDASLASAGGIPILWGTDAVHGHNNVMGATLFPHNIALGAAHDPALAARVAAATAKAVRATGIAWVFAPTLAVARDDRWGRSYESYSEDPALVREYARAVIAGLQGATPAELKAEGRVVATAKHFIGDGGTESGRDQGVTTASVDELRELHLQGYIAALQSGVQTVMASFNSWNALASAQGQRRDPGKMHGSHAMLTQGLKEGLGFDGLVVSDWNGIQQVPGCSKSSCAQAINAGIDLVMVPDDWKAFIANTVAQVQAGQIPLARIDDAVRRILRVKLRAGLFERRPANGIDAGRAAALVDRALAREAVRQSLVLLKNQGSALPLKRGQRVLVVGANADNISHQSGGWSLTWQGTGNSNADFPHADSILAGLRQALGSDRVVFSVDAQGVDVAAFDTVVAVLGETPYAEGNGDIPPSGTLRHSSRHPQDLAVLMAVAGRGRPVVTVFISGRPLWVNDLLNRSDAFVAAWLPGTEGAGVADVLVADAQGRPARDFSGRLSFSWPRGVCQTPLNAGDAHYDPLFALGHGLHFADGRQTRVTPPLDEAVPAGGCGAQTELVLFRQTAQPPYALVLESPQRSWPGIDIGEDVNGVQKTADAQLSTVQINTQQDAARIVWTGAADLVAWSPSSAALDAYPDAALAFDVRVEQPPAGTVTLTMECAEQAAVRCGASLQVTQALRSLPLNANRTIKVPLRCFAAAGVQLDRVAVPFKLGTEAPFTAAFANIRITAGAARDVDALPCSALPVQPFKTQP